MSPIPDAKIPYAKIPYPKNYWRKKIKKTGMRKDAGSTQEVSPCHISSSRFTPVAPRTASPRTQAVIFFVTLLVTFLYENIILTLRTVKAVGFLGALP
jgi:hypothetical protein